MPRGEEPWIPGVSVELRFFDSGFGVYKVLLFTRSEHKKGEIDIDQ